MKKKNNLRITCHPGGILIKAFLVLVVINMRMLAGADKPIGNGSFIQPWLTASWDDARWQQEFAYMKECEMQYLVIGPMIDCRPGEVSYTLYPSSLPNTRQYMNYDYADKVLRNAESAGIKVFIEISLHSEWWLVQSHDTTWLYPQMRLDREVCDELWTLYKSKYPNAFYGWYFAYEENNVDTQIPEKRDIFANAMNIVLDHLTATNKHLPFMWCPYMVAMYGTPQTYASNWIDIFSKLHTEPGDIFCPQDGICGTDITLDNLEDWFRELRKAVDTKPGLLFWSDLLTFDQNGGMDYLNAPLDRVVKQYQIEQPYVDDYITFAYSHYNSPYNTHPGYHATYLGYVKNGVLESVVPDAPQNVVAEVDSLGNVVLSWEAASDNIGIFGYMVYRDGVQIWKKQHGRLDGKNELPPLPLTMIDAGLLPGTDYIYEVKSYDFANNITSSNPVKIHTPDFKMLPNKISAACSYVVSVPADAKYPDNNNRELTDGAMGRIKSKADPAFEGVYDANKTKRDIIIDLGSVKPVQQFAAYFLYDTLSSIYLPKQIDVFVSQDNNTFTEAGNLLIPNIPEGTRNELFKCTGTLPEQADARYVKFSIHPLSTWTFDCEYEVRNRTVTSVEDEEPVPLNYSLFQNYPNPFNPSTIITYRIPEMNFVSLKLYSISGEEIKTLINEEQDAGTYSLTLETSELPSGIYMYRMIAGDYKSTKKLVKLK